MDNERTISLRMSWELASGLDAYVRNNSTVFASTAVQTMILAFLAAPEEFPPIDDANERASLMGKKRTSFSVSSDSYDKLASYAQEHNTTLVELIRRILFYSLKA